MLYRLFDKIMETGGTCFFVGALVEFYFDYPDVIPKAYADFYLKAMSLKSKGVEMLVEAGAGKVVSGLTRRIDRDLSSISIQGPNDIEAFLGDL